MSAPSRPVLGASACVWRGEEVLIAKRGKPPFIWSLPGGHVERGETLIAAAARELLEETGVTAEPLHFVEMAEIIREDAHYVIACFTGLWAFGEAAASSDAEAVAWVHPDRLAAYELTAGTQAVIAKARRLTR